ncbi:DUF4179 domain-containing protein [Halobacillus litoralis]|uniref:DUF4179 domain-containing protein n=1 Tax=Halobacillus litoralis TaxID=45668 RepID=UPI001CD6E8B2|nr:DUF4179 domain-containing protein [Halobacillus litoralis]MCA0970709.1 DUF4179 domain-containing protein [Halobacillus litoralis]
MTTKHDVEQELKQTSNQPLPKGLDQQIHLGMERGKRQRRRWDLVKNSGLSAAALLILFVLSVNFIPSFGPAASNIPGVKKLVELVEYDPGLKDAVDNKYVQVIDESDTENDVTFTIDHLIADQRRLILFYSVEVQGDIEALGLDGVTLTNSEGEKLEGYGLGSSPLTLENGKGSARLDFTFNQDQEFTNEMTLRFALEEHVREGILNGKKLDDPYEVTFAIDQDKIQASEVYEIKQSAAIEGQEIYFEKFISYPTSQVLYLEVNEDNTKEIFHMDSIRLENEHGEEVGTYSRSISDGNKRTISFTSDYFKDNEKLYIVAEKLMALDKGNTTVKVDLDNEKLLEAPDDRLSLRDIQTESIGDGEKGAVALNFGVDTSGMEQEVFYVLSGEYQDATGETFFSGSQAASAGSENTESVYQFYLDDNTYESPLTFQVSQYPSYIEGDIKVRVK